MIIRGVAEQNDALTYDHDVGQGQDDGHGDDLDDERRDHDVKKGPVAVVQCPDAHLENDCEGVRWVESASASD